MTRPQQIQMMKECLDDARETAKSYRPLGTSAKGADSPETVRKAIAFFEYRSNQSTRDAYLDAIEKYSKEN